MRATRGTATQSLAMIISNCPVLCCYVACPFLMFWGRKPVDVLLLCHLPHPSKTGTGSSSLGW
eukprot:3333256-Amphidinium_carterae.1